MQNGQAMHFAMGLRATDREFTKKLIEAGGGIMHGRVTKDCIKLLSGMDRARCAKTYHYFYIIDCIREGKLLDLEGYRMMPDTQALQINAWTFSFRMEEESERNKDVDVIKFIVDKKRFGELHHNSLWKDIEKADDLDHLRGSVKEPTWEEVKARFKERIAPAMDSYESLVEDKTGFQKLKAAVGEVAGPDSIHWATRCSRRAIALSNVGHKMSASRSTEGGSGRESEAPSTSKDEARVACPNTKRPAAESRSGQSSPKAQRKV